MERNGARLGSMIGAAAGLVFVLVNAGGLPGAVWLRALGVAAFVVVIVLVVRAPALTPAPGTRSATALRTYAVSVVAEVLALPLGAAALNALERRDLVLCWVVLVVGVHFLPFARAFGVPVFRMLGWVLVADALLGAIATLAGLEDADLATAVVAWFVLLLVSGYGALRSGHASGVPPRSAGVHSP